MAPSIVLIPGICSIGNVFYGPLKKELQALGYTDIIIIDLPSVDSVDRLSSLQPNALLADIEYIRQTIKGIVDAGKDVVIGAHSYGGTPSLYASEGLWKHARQANGHEGGVVKTVLLSSSLSLPGESIAGCRAKWATENDPEMLKAQDASTVQMIDDMPVLFPDGLEHAFLVDMSPEEQKEWATKGLRPSPLATVLSEAPDATVTDWRIAGLVTLEMDPSMPEPFQRFLFDNAKEHGAVVEEVKAMKSGHFVQVTHAKEVAAWMRTLCP